MNINWERTDIERRLLFRGGKYTSVNNWLSMLIGIALTIVFHALVYLLYQEGNYFGKIFFDRGPTPYFIIFLGFTSLAIIIKHSKLVLQRKTLAILIIPSENNFSLTSKSANKAMSTINETVDNSKKFMLYNSIYLALSNLKTIGRVGDVSEVLRSHAEIDESHMISSYTIIKGFVWAISVLGFIGTVLGLSDAIGSFSQALNIPVKGWSKKRHRRLSHGVRDNVNCSCRFTYHSVVDQCNPQSGRKMS